MELIALILHLSLFTHSLLCDFEVPPNKRDIILPQLWLLVWLCDFFS